MSTEDLVNLANLAKRSYSPVPFKLKGQFDRHGVVLHDREDEFGSRSRLKAITETLGNTALGEVYDLGGNAGYFSLELCGQGLAKRATVFDTSEELLELGRQMANATSLGDQVHFLNQPIDLDFIKTMPAVDTVICLNLLHHAGILFDVETVRKMGWETYLYHCLVAFQQKCNVLIFGVGLKGKKPTNWPIAPFRRARKIVSVAERAGWAVVYDANVLEIARLGVRKADNSRKKFRFKELVNGLSESTPLVARLKNKSSGKLGDYHLYILRN